MFAINDKEGEEEGEEGSGDFSASTPNQVTFCSTKLLIKNMSEHRYDSQLATSSFFCSIDSEEEEESPLVLSAESFSSGLAC